MEVVMTAEQMALVRDSWARVSAGDRRLVPRFYAELFRLQPELVGLFRSDERVQARMFQAALTLIVGNLDAPPCEQYYLVMLGRRHAQWNVRRAHFEAGRTALLGVLQECLGEIWTPRLRKAWQLAYDRMVDGMLSGATSRHAK